MDFLCFSVTCANVCEDSSLIAVGFQTSTIRVSSLTTTKLRGMKNPDQLEIIDKEAGSYIIMMCVLLLIHVYLYMYIYIYR